MYPGILTGIALYTSLEVLAFGGGYFTLPHAKSPIDASAFGSLLASTIFVIIIGIHDGFSGWLAIAFPFSWLLAFPGAWLGTVYYRHKKRSGS